MCCSCFNLDYVVLHYSVVYIMLNLCVSIYACIIQVQLPHVGHGAVSKWVRV